MKRQTRSEQIQNAIDTTLSGLKDDPRLAQRVIRAARQMETPKRKRFYGMVLAALLLLLAATAVAAAYLSAQQFVQQEVLPLAQEMRTDMKKNSAIRSLRKLFGWRGKTALRCPTR